MGITCKQATDYISRKEEGKLSLRQRFQLWRHLAICSLCKLFSKQNKLIIRSMENQPAEETDRLNPQEKQSLIKLVEDFPGEL